MAKIYAAATINENEDNWYGDNLQKPTAASLSVIKRVHNEFMYQHTRGTNTMLNGFGRIVEVNGNKPL